jgi:hypothetical protein
MGWEAITNPGVAAGIDYLMGQRQAVEDRRNMPKWMAQMRKRLERNPESDRNITHLADTTNAIDTYRATAQSTGDASLDAAREARFAGQAAQAGGLAAQQARMGMLQTLMGAAQSGMQGKYASLDSLNSNMAQLYGQRDQMVQKTPWWQTALSIGMGGLGAFASGGAFGAGGMFGKAA